MSMSVVGATRWAVVAAAGEGIQRERGESGGGWGGAGRGKKVSHRTVGGVIAQPLVCA